MFKKKLFDKTQTTLSFSLAYNTYTLGNAKNMIDKKNAQTTIFFTILHILGGKSGHDPHTKDIVTFGF